MPYRVDISSPPPEALDALAELGALDVEPVHGGLAAILPEAVTLETVTAALGSADVTVSEAVGRDNGSVWLVCPRAIQIGRVLIAPPELTISSSALRLIDSSAFGSGHHPTTAVCIEALEQILSGNRLESILDVGTGSGILALAALMMAVPQAVGLDTDAEALRVAAQNAKLNQFEERLKLVHGGPEAVDGTWPLVVANVLAAPLIQMAPVLVRRVASGGRLLLSGIASSLALEVQHAYQHFGMHQIDSTTRDGWTLLIMRASW